jgi:hypothetical protein
VVHVEFATKINIKVDFCKDFMLNFTFMSIFFFILDIMSVEEEGIKIGGGDKHLYELERASCHVGKSIFSGWRKYHSRC